MREICAERFGSVEVAVTASGGGQSGSTSRPRSAAPNGADQLVKPLERILTYRIPLVRKDTKPFPSPCVLSLIDTPADPVHRYDRVAHESLE